MEQNSPIWTVIVILLVAIGVVIALSQSNPASADNLGISLLNSPVSPIDGGNGGGGGNNGGGGGNNGNKDSSESSPASKGEAQPGQAGVPVSDPEGGTGGTFVFPKGTLNVPAQVKIFPISTNASNVQGIAGSLGLFSAGIWPMGVGQTTNTFPTPIVLNFPYDDSKLTPGQEANLRLYMFDPQLPGWLVLGGFVNPFTNQVSGITTQLTPRIPGGQTLIKLAPDNTGRFSQQVFANGRTRLMLDGSNFSFTVGPNVVKPGTHFQATVLNDVLGGIGPRFDSTPIYLVAYIIDHANYASGKHQEIRQLNGMIALEFTASPEAGTVMIYQNGEWVDMKSLGYSVFRMDDKLIVKTDILGIFAVVIN